MECKFSRGREVWKSETGINRYIMECKFDSAESFFCSYFGINRYIMECKFICVSDTSLADGELIDTLWNVNINDTLFLCDILRINRYIMECKFNRIGIRINP